MESRIVMWRQGENMRHIVINYSHCVLCVFLSTFVACGPKGNFFLPSFGCPDNYVRVPALSGYTDEDFCVSKYEMKDGGGGVPASTPDGNHYLNMSKNNILNLCAGIGPEYDLMTNDQWQTLARNIELVPKNWSSGTVGQGEINRGHYTNNPSNALPASADDNMSCSGTMQACDLGTWNAQRRTHRLSTRDVIWDVSGNVAEFVQDNNVGNVNYGTTNVLIGGIAISGSWMSQVTNTSHPVTGSLSASMAGARTVRDHFGSTDNYAHLNTGGFGGLGLLSTALPAVGTSIIFRGGRHDIRSGIFFAMLQVNQATSIAVGTFRCVYQL